MSSEFNPAIDSSAWFIKDEDVKDIPAPARELLESYANVAPEDILPHVLKLVCFHPCLYKIGISTKC